jgi:hypothetical protein
MLRCDAPVPGAVASLLQKTIHKAISASHLVQIVRYMVQSLNVHSSCRCIHSDGPGGFARQSGCEFS